MIKKIFFIVLVPLTLFSLDVKDIAKKIDVLKLSRDISPTLNYKIYDPFAKAKPIIKEKKVYRKKLKPIVIQTIFNNRVFINSRWLKRGDTVNGMKIKHIYKSYVVIGQRKYRVKTHKNLIKMKEDIK